MLTLSLSLLLSRSRPKLLISVIQSSMKSSLRSSGIRSRNGLTAVMASAIPARTTKIKISVFEKILSLLIWNSNASAVISIWSYL